MQPVSKKQGENLITDQLAQLVRIEGGMGENIGHLSGGVARAVDVAAADAFGFAVVPELFEDARYGGGVVIAMKDVSAALAALLAESDIQHGRAEAGGFDDAAGAVADEHRGVTHQGEEMGAGQISVESDAGGAFVLLPATDDARGAGVVVGVDDDRLLERDLSDRVQDQFRAVMFSLFIRLDRMEGHEGETMTSALVRGCRRVVDVVEAGGADLVDSPLVLAEAEDAIRTRFRGGEVEVGELGDGVAEGVVDLAERAVAAVDVGEAAVGDVCGNGGGE